ncbi:CRISPR-associated endonuclease/helicase Cas3 [Candidatus Kryptonium thompsonii]|uniref:CRISPR-associated endonuclease/helicase Cas3 n=1 Tax=Candidatus Kryptonium thompsonii TaxID=1633631 RepID=A0A0P1NYK4_9BACT|nr:CRISPR-associated helicase/endonuclease Cas3 [Candidatus Kryptonium thompsoni]CUS77357.1 CRISPR-associated endonuclease/helicase Cas3 [Candidatus Kryptonium thompsoni]CUS79614.1 CRISPR-associated endonuclease/helicase Cas3 [Candidatus Kryptonium thompsoni]CUS89633.1 CRISPR-associated endonuclease/helicase Cas3 [Candidatus Kryptonium thompsoni]CUS89941.1 CRISPR-associated endonuclease/helicase Cas3 [Candidatus Kryptonium thompsoni]CUT04226.1 CRISPR-associated endonuclease/helicase Cas3 [Cand
MVDEIIAKSHPQKTLKEHIEDVLNAFEDLKRLGGKLGIQLEDKDWEILRKPCFYHDFGKANSAFQKKIRGSESHGASEIPHNFLSLLFIEDDDELLLKMVAFHHWRNFPDLKDDKIINEIYSDVQNYIEKLSTYFNRAFTLVKRGIFRKNVEILRKYYSRRIDGVFDLEKESKFVILLGLLNRIDHSASAGVLVESEPIDKYGKTENFLLTKTKQPWQLVEISDELKNKSGIVLASTGMGKTEMALLWSDRQKTFYTLPVRTSVTAMYERMAKLFGKDNVGLLHSGALSDLLFEWENTSTDDAFYHYEMAKDLSYPLIVSTADQVFTATLKYFGFEKIYATLSYSKVVVDEIQAYSPETMAVITHGLGEISKIGGKFLVVTATLPSFLKDRLEEYSEFCITKVPKLKKHKIKLVDEPLSGNTLKNFITSIRKDRVKKILVVCNTVKRSQELYDSLKEFSPLLLHSRFVRMDRASKEDKVLREDFEGILISTQVIEVSLDIDFDVLITELAPLDVLIQRMGRVYRRFKTDGEFYPSGPNVYIFTRDVSGLGNVYEKEIVEKTKSLLKDSVLSEEQKVKMVEDFYSEKNLKETSYWTKFSNALGLIENFSVDKKSEAQRIFRGISQIEVIPESLLEREVQNLKILNELNLNKAPLKDIIERIKVKDKKEKIFVMELIKDFMVPIPLYRTRMNSLVSLSGYIDNDALKELLANVKVVNYEYDYNVGLILSGVEDSADARIID